MNNTVKMIVLPDCDFCKRDGVKKIAHVDGATMLGPWAYMCRAHYRQYGLGIGTGVGQYLVLDVPQPKQRPVSGGAIR